VTGKLGGKKKRTAGKRAFYEEGGKPEIRGNKKKNDFETFKPSTRGGQEATDFVHRIKKRKGWDGGVRNNLERKK